MRLSGRLLFGRRRLFRLQFGLVVSQDVFDQRMDAILKKSPDCTRIAQYVTVCCRTEKELDDDLMNLTKVSQENGVVFSTGKCIVKTREMASSVPCLSHHSCEKSHVTLSMIVASTC